MPHNIFEELTSSTYKSVTRMFDKAIEEQVDFIIIAGDVFDRENRTLKAETFLKKGFERLKDNGIFVYMIHGNHDPLSENVKSKWPDNVSVFKENVETFERDRKSTRLNSSHVAISYAVFCLKKSKRQQRSAVS